MDVGIDLDPANIAEAQQRNVYLSLSRASATALPFADASFASIVSNCVLEHIPDIDSVFREAARLLRPGGQFIFSVPTDRLNPSMFTPTLLTALGVKSLAGKYMDWFTRMQVHYHMYSPDRWQKIAEQAGLRVIQRTGYLSPRAAKFVELGHYLGVPNLLFHKLLGRWVVWPWRPRFALIEKILTPLVLEHDPPGATCCFFVTVKDK
jgi:SAM-dependent methyltransferase